jgi:hypothetical protein
MNNGLSALTACRTALAQGLRTASPNAVLDEKGYTSDLHHNLIEGVALEDFEADLRQGDGNELEGKFRAAHSSSALAVNNFAPFKTKISDLKLPGSSDFDILQFERKCPNGLAGRKAPNLDVLAAGAAGIVAIESKCLEYLSSHTAEFSPAYDREIQDVRRQSGWFGEMQQLADNPKRYRWLDAAQLVKHAFGLAHTFPDNPVTLVYLFWEPENPGVHPVFAQHRQEIANFRAAVGADTIGFFAMSYPELWDSWATPGAPQWLATHVARMRARYGIRI